VGLVISPSLFKQPKETLLAEDIVLCRDIPKVSPAIQKKKLWEEIEALCKAQ